MRPWQEKHMQEGNFRIRKGEMREEKDQTRIVKRKNGEREGGGTGERRGRRGGGGDRRERRWRGGVGGGSRRILIYKSVNLPYVVCEPIRAVRDQGLGNAGERGRQEGGQGGEKEEKKKYGRRQARIKRKPEGRERGKKEDGK